MRRWLISFARRRRPDRDPALILQRWVAETRGAAIVAGARLVRAGRDRAARPTSGGGRPCADRCSGRSRRSSPATVAVGYATGFRDLVVDEDVAMAAIARRPRSAGPGGLSGDGVDGGPHAGVEAGRARPRAGSPARTATPGPGTRPWSSSRLGERAADLHRVRRRPGRRRRGLPQPRPRRDRRRGRARRPEGQRRRPAVRDPRARRPARRLERRSSGARRSRSGSRSPSSASEIALGRTQVRFSQPRWRSRLPLPPLQRSLAGAADHQVRAGRAVEAVAAPVRRRACQRPCPS